MQIFVCKRWHLLHSSSNKAVQPKLTTGAVNYGTMVQKAIRVMKLTAFFILATCLHVNATGYGQKVTLSEREVHIEKIFSEIKKQTGFNFLYTSNILAGTKRVTVNVTNALVTEVLDIVLAGQGLEYRVKGEDRLIIIKPRQLQKEKTDKADVIQAKSDPIDVRGKVVDEKGKPVPGVTITVKNTKRQTITNENGEFSVPGVSEDAVLLFSSVNMEAYEINVSGRSQILAQLKSKTSELDEVQIIAYGQTTKRFQTGNVTTVKGADIAKQPVGNALLALQGRVTGLLITQSAGLPGTGVTVRIQGQNSIFNGNDPLYVIDGVPYFSQLPSSLNGILGTSNAYGAAGATGNPLSFINPLDIETIEVLKDADATAIFGSRAANGAILITTKKGKVGKTKFDLNLQRGWGKITRKMDLLNTEQYLDMRKQALNNDGITTPSTTTYDVNGVWDTTRYTDWQEELIGGTAKFTNFQASFSGGSDNTQFMMGAGYNSQTTVFPGELGDKKGNIHLNLNHKNSNQKLTIQFQFNYQYDKNMLLNENLVNSAIYLPPNAPALFNPDGTLNWETSISGRSTWRNPLSYLKQKYDNTSTNLISSAIIGYKILSGLEVKSNFGYNKFQSEEISTTPLISLAPERRQSTTPSSLFGNNTIYTWIVEPQVVYNKEIFKGKLETLIGSTILQTTNNGKQISSRGYSSDLLIEDVRSAPIVRILSTTSSIYKYNALFTRINYNLKSKYILNVSGRRDGSSRFGPENRFHNFGSIGAAWIFTQENVFIRKPSSLSYGKISGSYGTTGNDQIGEYNFMSLYSAVAGLPYQGVVGLTADRLTNPYLQWESTKKLGFVLDLGFFKDKILLKVAHFSNRSSNQLLGYTLPIITGFGGITSNFPATVKNSGWEFALNTTNFSSRSFRWTSGFNLTINKNELVSFPNLATSGYASRLIVGEPITIFHAYQLLGVNPATGLYEFIGKDKTNTSDPAFPTDATVIINTTPEFFGGFQNNIQYKGFELDFLFQFVKQIGYNYKYGFRPGIYFGGANFGNQPTTVLQNWKTPGDNSAIQAFSSEYPGNVSNAFSAAELSDKSWADASYIRLKNISLYWELPRKMKDKLKFGGGRVFIQGQNLVTITNYVGLDPETATGSLSLPPLKVVNFGMQFTL